MMYSVSRMHEVRTIPPSPRQFFHLGRPQDQTASPYGRGELEKPSEK